MRAWKKSGQIIHEKTTSFLTKTNIDSILNPSYITQALALLGKHVEALQKAPIIIAIDGYSSSGKSTLARDLASVLSYKHIDSGAMYRAVTLYLLRNGISSSSITAVSDALTHIHIDFKATDQGNRTMLNGEDVEEEIRTLEVSKYVSEVSAIPDVRRFLVVLQQSIGKDKAIIMDGRDIGTVVFPDADVKLFVEASPEVRIQRRFDELVVNHPDITLELVKKNLEKRDHIDSTRKDSPLRMAEDAILIDTSEFDRNQQLLYALKSVFEATGISK
jgi:cytidylate kinase